MVGSPEANGSSWLSSVGEDNNVGEQGPELILSHGQISVPMSWV